MTMRYNHYKFDSLFLLVLPVLPGENNDGEDDDGDNDLQIKTNLTGVIGQMHYNSILTGIIPDIPTSKSSLSTI